MSNVSLFWSRPPKSDDTLESWVNTEIKLYDFHDLGLNSHVKFGNNATIYTYQKIISDIPSGINIENASKFYSAESAFNSLVSGHSIAHIADLVRLKASLKNNGVVIDMDAVMVNPFPDIDCFTSTLPAKTTGGMAIKFGKSHPPFTIHDNSWDGKALSIFPIKIHESIQDDIETLIGKIESQLSSSPQKSSTKSWNYIMYALKDIANRNPNVKVLQPIHCGPVPAWHSKGKCYSLESPTRLDGKTSLFGYTLPSIEKIMKESYCVQHFFESCFKSSDQIENFWDKVKENSLLDIECKLIYGNDWKNKKQSINTLF